MPRPTYAYLPADAERLTKNGVNAIAYLTDVLTRIQTHPASRVDELLPHRWKPPDGAART